MSTRCLLNLGDQVNKYTINSQLGKGAFSDVYSVKNSGVKNSDKDLALKIIRNEPHFNKQVHIEVTILNILNKGKSKFMPILLEQFEFKGHKCLIFEIYGENLYKVIKKQPRKRFNTTDCISITAQITMALAYFEKYKVIHCDIKPENILCKKGSDVSHIIIADYGSSCFNVNTIVTSYIQTRYYRAPEIILGIKFSYPIDVWSLGCIIYELYFGHPLFEVKSSTAVLKSMIQIMGLPPQEIIKQGSPKEIESYFNEDGNFKYLRTIPFSRKITDELKEAPIYDLLDKIFCWDPTKRIKPPKILEHYFVSTYV